MDSRNIIQNVLDYIDENIKSEISNNDLCNIAGYSYIHLVRLFKQYLGISPNEYILKRRLLFAVYEMNGDLSKTDIAFEFASWLNVEFKLYLITEFERLKKNEAYQSKIEWSVKRELSKTNYVIHTDSIKEFIVPTLTKKQKQFIYANEADVLNVALFGITAKEWHESNPDLSGNIRDYTDILHLVVLANLENLNAEMITTGLSQSERLVKLNKTAQRQLKLLKDNSSIKKLENMNEQLKFK